MTPTKMNDQTIEAEVTALAVRPQMAVAQPMTVTDILNQVKLIQEVMRNVMKEGEHYGKIPGCGEKATLLQPGAQKLTMTFRLAPEYEIQETNFDKGHKEYRVVCTLKSIQSGSFVGQGVGCCSTLESKYRYRGGARKCPKCGKETIIKGKAEYGGGWLCWTKKNGCGATWPDGAQEIEGQSVEKVEHENPADFYNTVLKMSKKRAFVDATITATAASDIFTQDVFDEEADAAPEAPKPAPAAPQRTQPAKHVQSTPKTVKVATEATRTWFLEQLGDARAAAWDYFVSTGKLSDALTLSDLPLEHVPTSHAAVREFTTMLARVQAGGPVREATPDNEAWKTFVMPVGKNKGKTLDEIDKKALWGLWKNYEVSTEWNGKPISVEKIAQSERIRAMLDDAGKACHFDEPKEKQEDDMPPFDHLEDPPF